MRLLEIPTGRKREQCNECHYFTDAAFCTRHLKQQGGNFNKANIYRQGWWKTTRLWRQSSSHFGVCTSGFVKESKKTLLLLPNQIVWSVFERTLHLARSLAVIMVTVCVGENQGFSCQVKLSLSHKHTHTHAKHFNAFNRSRCHLLLTFPVTVSMVTLHQNRAQVTYDYMKKKRIKSKTSEPDFKVTICNADRSICNSVSPTMHLCNSTSCIKYWYFPMGSYDPNLPISCSPMCPTKSPVLKSPGASTKCTESAA